MESISYIYSWVGINPGHSLMKSISNTCSGVSIQVLPRKQGFSGIGGNKHRYVLNGGVGIGVWEGSSPKQIFAKLENDACNCYIYILDVLVIV